MKNFIYWLHTKSHLVGKILFVCLYHKLTLPKNNFFLIFLIIWHDKVEYISLVHCSCCLNYLTFIKHHFTAQIWPRKTAAYCQHPVGCSWCFHLLVDIHVAGSDHTYSPHQTQSGQTLLVPTLHQHSHLCCFGWVWFRVCIVFSQHFDGLTCYDF